MPLSKNVLVLQPKLKTQQKNECYYLIESIAFIFYFLNRTKAQADHISCVMSRLWLVGSKVVCSLCILNKYSQYFYSRKMLGLWRNIRSQRFAVGRYTTGKISLTSLLQNNKSNRFFFLYNHDLLASFDISDWQHAACKMPTANAARDCLWCFSRVYVPNDCFLDKVNNT